MKRIALIALGLSVAGCTTKSAVEEARQQAAQNAAERDSLVAEVLATAALVNEINVELSRVSDTSLTLALPTEGGLEAAKEENEVALAKIRTAINQLIESQAEIESQRERISSLSGSESSLLRQLANYEKTIEDLRTSAERREAEYKAVIEQQRSMIATLARTVDTVRAQNETLALQNVELSDSVTTLAEVSNTVYYAVGTKSELEDLGIVVNEGSKFLIFGSKTLQPARDLDPAAFTAIDKFETTQIPFPRSDKSYRILTRQNPAFLLSPTDKDGKLREMLEIASPDEFWSASRFLILVQN